MENTPNRTKTFEEITDKFKELSDINKAQSKQIEWLVNHITELKTETNSLTLIIQSMLLHLTDKERKDKIYDTAHICIDAMTTEVNGAPLKDAHLKHLNLTFRK
ncbi:hypothetical protein [Providencia sp. PROV212]|uniref:hypothetical protein n=1 Tax=Providencia sp. PROV212 TaxID=2949909 RepID=UPI0023492D8C|nr:hypothetical protein [Providencia sp. PROV212]